MLDKTNMSGVIYIWVELYISLMNISSSCFIRLIIVVGFSQIALLLGCITFCCATYQTLKNWEVHLNHLTNVHVSEKNIFKTSGNKEISAFQCTDLPYQHQTLIIEEFEPDVFRLLPISKDVIYINYSTMDSPWLDKS